MHVLLLVLQTKIWDQKLSYIFTAARVCGALCEKSKRRSTKQGNKQSLLSVLFQSQRAANMII